jgi:hypothetical protein
MRIFERLSLFFSFVLDPGTDNPVAARARSRPAVPLGARQNVTKSVTGVGTVIRLQNGTICGHSRTLVEFVCFSF